MLFCSQCFSYSNPMPISSPPEEQWQRSLCPCHPVPSGSTSTDAGRGAGIRSNSLHPPQTPSKAKEGHSTPHCSGTASLKHKLNTKIGLTLGYDFISPVFPIWPSTFLMEDSQIDNKIPGFSAR